MAFSQPSFFVLSVEAWISLQKPPKGLILLPTPSSSSYILFFLLSPTKVKELEGNYKILFMITVQKYYS
ncbi:hypothetical protein SLEP1_g51554 [Rubroshorea leprosula]|uniref:Uncharacterized protein n=1 Tax=Rubroshorea leprosula TaxID=152421 RepID=A0AAV5M3L6_9ROSI|nr:hypothetical protein SLEP1_g51554 [Rubroshorea leprosula]